MEARQPPTLRCPFSAVRSYFSAPDYRGTGSRSPHPFCQFVERQHEPRLPEVAQARLAAMHSARTHRPRLRDLASSRLGLPFRRLLPARRGFHQDGDGLVERHGAALVLSWCLGRRFPCRLVARRVPAAGPLWTADAHSGRSGTRTHDTRTHEARELPTAPSGYPYCTESLPGGARAVPLHFARGVPAGAPPTCGASSG